jgi:hypothetical protein
MVVASELWVLERPDYGSLLACAHPTPTRPTTIPSDLAAFYESILRSRAAKPINRISTISSAALIR